MRARKQKLTLLKDRNASDWTDVLCATVVETGVDPLRKSYMYILPTIGNKKNLNHNSTNVNKP